MKIILSWFSDWRSYLAEFFATFLFIFIASSAVLSELYFGDLGKVGLSLAIGFSYAALVYISVHLSGGYLNPVVTVALWLAQKLSGVKAVFFIIAQVLASFAAAGLIYYIFGSSSLDFGLGGPILGVNVNMQVASVLEAVMSAVLVFCVFSTMIDRGGPVSFGPLVLGFLLSAMTLVSFSVSGAAFNPVRSIGPAVISGTYGDLAVYVIGPLAGSLFGVLYDYLFLKKRRK